MKNLVAKDIMVTDILTVGVDWPLSKLIDFLLVNSISGVPVTNEKGELFGVVSLTDIVRHDSLHLKEPTTKPHDFFTDSFDRENEEDEVGFYRIETESNVTVNDIMTPTIFEVAEDSKIQDVADIMIRGRIHRVFVTRNKKVIGIISAIDILKVIRDL